LNQRNGEKRIIIAIDGPAASGKSTTARKVAERLGYTYIDTGAMYRSVTLKAIESGMMDTIRSCPEKVEELLAGILVSFSGDRILLDGSDVTLAIRENRISREVSFISSLKPVRDTMRQMQQDMGRGRGVVMDGRDIGTVVFPEAELKVFLTADARQRAMRRYAELAAKSADTAELPGLEELEQEILDRDRADAEREHAPLKKHPDARELDTSALTIDAQTDIVCRMAEEILKEKR